MAFGIVANLIVVVVMKSALKLTQVDGMTLVVANVEIMMLCVPLQFLTARENYP